MLGLSKIQHHLMVLFHKEAMLCICTHRLRWMNQIWQDMILGQKTRSITEHFKSFRIMRAQYMMTIETKSKAKVIA